MTPDGGDGAAPTTARGRGEPPRGRRARSGGGVSTLLATIIAVAALIVGVLVGYAAHGGPDPPSDLSVVTDLPTVTVTVPASTGTR